MDVDYILNNINRFSPTVIRRLKETLPKRLAELDDADRQSVIERLSASPQLKDVDFGTITAPRLAASNFQRIASSPTATLNYPVNTSGVVPERFTPPADIAQWGTKPGVTLTRPQTQLSSERGYMSPTGSTTPTYEKWVADYFNERGWKSGLPSFGLSEDEYAKESQLLEERAQQAKDEYVKRYGQGSQIKSFGATAAQWVGLPTVSKVLNPSKPKINPTDPLWDIATIATLGSGALPTKSAQLGARIIGGAAATGAQLPETIRNPSPLNIGMTAVTALGTGWEGTQLLKQPAVQQGIRKASQTVGPAVKTALADERGMVTVGGVPEKPVGRPTTPPIEERPPAASPMTPQERLQATNRPTVALTTVGKTLPTATKTTAAIEGEVIQGIGRQPPGRMVTETLVSPEAGIKLPEPPRNIQEYAQAASREVGAPFRKPKGVMETVETAHQMVLKSRDVGKNTIPYVQSYLRQAGNTTKEFGLNAQGMATKIDNPRNLSTAINDVLSNPTKYKLTPAQQEIAKRHGEIYKAARELAKSYGVEIGEMAGPDDYWQYIARRVKAKFNPQTGQYDMPPSTIGGFKMGSKISAQKERVFETMLEGADLGYLYEHPDQTMSAYLNGVYRLIGNKQAENLVKPLTRIVTKENPVTFSEKLLYQPALSNRAAAAELAAAIDKIYQVEKPWKSLEIASKINEALVGQIAALDLSAPFIQGLQFLGRDIKNAMQFKPSAVWLKSYGRMMQTLYNPETMKNFRMNNADWYKKAIEAGIMTGDSEFVTGVGLTENMLGKVPVAGKTLKEVYRQLWGRTGAAYSDFLEAAKIESYKIMEQPWAKAGGNRYQLGQYINRLGGSISSAARGVGVNRRLFERSLFFAPNYLRGSLLLLKDMVGTSVKARDAQATIATMLGVGAGLYYFEEKLRGREPKMKPWPKTMGGDGSDAFTTEIGGTRVGLGSWMYGMIKMLAEIGAIAVDNPDALVKVDENHPVSRFLKSKLGVGAGLAREMLMGENYYGQPYDSPKDYLLRLTEAIVPISAQSMITQEPKGSPVQAGAELLGMRAYPYSDRSRWTDEGVFNDYNALPKNDIELQIARQKDPTTMSRTQYRDTHPEIEAKLFVTGQVDSMSNWKSVQATRTLIESNQIKPEDVGGFKANLKAQNKLADANLNDKRLTPTDMLVKSYTLTGKELEQILSEIDLLSAYQDVLDNVADDRAKTKIKKVLRKANADLDIMVVLTNGGNLTDSSRATDLAKRMGGSYKGEVKPFDAKQAATIVNAIVPYYRIEDVVWQKYGQSLRDMSDKIDNVQQEKGTAAANKLLKMYPDIVKARDLIARYKKDYLDNNKLAEYLLKY